MSRSRRPAGPSPRPDAGPAAPARVSKTRFPTVAALAKMTERHGQFDEYVWSGKNNFVIWSANGRDVAVWEKTVKGLTSKNFCARLAGGETVTPEVMVMLRTAIIAHADAYGP